MELKSISNVENTVKNTTDSERNNFDKRAEVNQNKSLNRSNIDAIDKRVDVTDKKSLEKSSHDTPDDRVKSKELSNSQNNKANEISSNEKDFVISKEPLDVGDHRIGTAKENKENGIDRENKFNMLLSFRYLKAFGYEVMSERVLRDKNGNVVKDSQTNTARRIDFIVAKNGTIIKSFEVTSKTAPKNEQMAKEYRIRDNGGNYIKDNNGNMLRIPNNVQTDIVRMK